MRIRDKNKLAHEKSVADELLGVLKIKPLGSRQGNPDKKEPDRIYRIDKKTIGIEVVTVYYSDEEAKATAEAAAEKPIADDEIRPGAAIGSPDDSMCDAIKECLEEKCKKAYSGTDETWLCINADATITESAVIEKCVKSLKVPKHGFTRLFVTQRKSANEGGGLIVIEFKQCLCRATGRMLRFCRHNPRGVDSRPAMSILPHENAFGIFVVVNLATSQHYVVPGRVDQEDVLRPSLFQ